MMIQEIDFQILDWIQQNLRNGLFDWLMPKITLLGEAGIFWIFLTLVFLLKKEYRKCGWAMLVGLLCSLFVGNILLKNIVGRARPCWINQDIEMLVAVPRDYSFPSGHTLASFISSVILLCYERRFGIWALLLAFVIAFSRLYLYVHFPTDVLAGMLLGILIGLAVVMAFKGFEKRKLQQN